MRITTTFVILAFYLICGGNGFYAVAAPVTLPWSTTFNCNEWKQADGLYKVNCDNLKGWGAWTCDNGDGTNREEQITSEANHAFGGGGKGQRHWIGDVPTTVIYPNKNSGGLSIEFTPAQPDLWVRWYMRYQTGFKWNYILEDKIIYFDVLSKQTSVIVAWEGDKSKILAQSAGSQTFKSSGANKGWTGTMGKADSDGLWHFYEVHLKMDTNGTNGAAEMWIDGVQTISATGVNWGTHPGWTYILFGSNNRYANNGGCRAVDFDDIAINNTGYIGPLGTPKPTISQIP